MSAPPFLRRPTPAPYFQALFLIFQIPSSGGGNQNLLLFLLKKEGEGLNYEICPFKDLEGAIVQPLVIPSNCYQCSPSNLSIT